MFSKIRKHLRQGTLVNVIKNKILVKTLEKTQPEVPLKFISRVTESESEASEFLSERIPELVKGRRTAVYITDDSEFSKVLEKRLLEKSVSLTKMGLKELDQIEEICGSETDCILSSFLDAPTIHLIGSRIIDAEKIRNIPFEYVCIPKSGYMALSKYDGYNDHSFVSPVLISAIDINELYERSLDVFGLRTKYFHYTAKCDIRDFMDLSQIIYNVQKGNIEGDIAEFGSYQGHSGYLISELLERYNSNKKLYMFDTFESFPGESLGIDSFWSNTHKVDFEEVKLRFSEKKNVRLVKGDFTQTFDAQGIEKLSFIYVDCDSYRATLFLTERLFEKVLSPGGIMVFEDYGHPALLGNRLAVHKYFDKRQDCRVFFSQFSGYYIVFKN